jgi:hypothetical protein
MNCVIYAKQNDGISVYEQYNQCAALAKRLGYSVSGKVLDFDGTKLHEAINKVIAEHDVSVLIIHSKDIVFSNSSDYIFYKIYLDKLEKRLIIVE